MSHPLSEALDHALDNQQDGTLEVAGPNASATVDVTASGPVGVRVRSIAVTSPRGDVQDTANALPHALRALLEPLQPVEVAPTLRGAVLRTDPTAIEDDEFFEVELRDDTVRIDRFRRESTGRRPVEFDLTRKQLRRIVDGLTTPEEA